MPPLHEVAVVGGGRWARVLTEVLCELLPTSTRISMHSRHCVNELARWVTAQGLEQRIRVSPEWPVPERPGSSAVIIANAARDHESAARHALRSATAVLVEKPLALSAAGARGLANLACDVQGRLAAAHVFLFAQYLNRFASLLRTKDDPRLIRVRWIDPPGERRYGETKQFDAGLPVFADVLPHVSSILGVLAPDAPQEYAGIRVLRGGAQVELQLMIGGVPCHVLLARNGPRRERVIEVLADGSTVHLDFTVEPGIVVDNGVELNADPAWPRRSRPLKSMLEAFLHAAASGRRDARLSLEPALQACALIDQISKAYHDALACWLTARFATPGMDAELRYALNEILQANGPLTSAMLEHEIEELRRMQSGADPGGWIQSIARLNAHYS